MNPDRIIRISCKDSSLLKTAPIDIKLTTSSASSLSLFLSTPYLEKIVYVTEISRETFSMADNPSKSSPML